MSTNVLEPAIFPLELFEPYFRDEIEARSWFTIYTRSRQEKALARELYKYQVPFYLPLVSSDRVSGGKRVKRHLPLFAGYIFIFADDDERVMTLKTNRVSRVLPVEDQAQLLHDLSQLSQLIASDAPLTVERKLEVGHRVNVKSGPFQGFEGTVVQRRGQRRLVVSVNYLQQGVSVEVDDVLLEPIYS